MHRIFTIQEIIDEMLSKLSPSQLATTVCVNRIWFFSSLPGLWKDVKLSNVLKILGEVSENSPNGYSFLQREPPTPAQCYRFFVYCKYVRILVGSEHDIGTLATIASFRPNNIQYFFPNLRSLTWQCADARFLIERFPATDLTVLISPSLTTFSLDLRDIPLQFFRSVCYTLIIRVRALRVLRVCMDSRDSMQSEDPTGCIDSFGLVLQSFRKTLEHVTMPEIFHTEEIVAKLGQIPNLCELVIGTTLETDFRHYALRNEGDIEQDFKRLDTLSFNGSQHALCKRFLGKRRFSSLTDIFWRQCMKIVDPKSFVMTIVGTCPQLRTLVVGDPDAYKYKEELPPIVPWRVIRILLRCHRIAGLSLHCCRVSMVPEDWIELLTSCEMWQAIHIYSVTPLRLSDLPVFLRYCPLLTALGIYVDVRSISDVDPNDTPLPPSIISPRVAHELTQPGPDGPLYDNFLCLYDVDFGYSRYYPHLGPKIASFIRGMCNTTSVTETSIFIPPLSVGGWNWPWKEFRSYLYEETGPVPGESMELEY